MSYTPLPVPNSHRGPSGETGQILLGGTVQKISLFHGQTDDEADWHVYIRPHPADWPDDLYCEIMVLDDFSQPSFIGDDKFFTADVTRAFHLVHDGSPNPAWDVGRRAIEDQGHSVPVAQAGVASRLLDVPGARAYLQGAYVNDEAHGTQPEIHPLDSIAFAMEDSGEPLAATWGDAEWPETSVWWRVAYFANSSIHRINNEEYVNKERTTTWLLDIPKQETSLTDLEVTLTDLEVTEVRRPLHVKNTGERHNGRGVKSIAPHQLVTDPADGRTKLKVGATMNTPGKLGGIAVIDYNVKSGFVPPKDKL